MAIVVDVRVCGPCYLLNGRVFLKPSLSIWSILMVQATNMHHSFHLQLLPIEASPSGITNLEIVQHSYGHLTCRQNLMSLRSQVELPKICDSTDVMIAILFGNGSLTLDNEVVMLEPGVFVFIPAHTPHTLQTRTSLAFLLNRCESDSTSESVWVGNL